MSEGRRVCLEDARSALKLQQQSHKLGEGLLTLLKDFVSVDLRFSVLSLLHALSVALIKHSDSAQVAANSRQQHSLPAGFQSSMKPACRE